MKKSIGARPLVQPCPVFIVGTYDENGVPNMMNAAWGGICCSKPPCVQVSIRSATYTHHNIVNNKAFTVNIPSAGNIKEADYAGLYSGRNENKFEGAGLTPVKSDLVNAPMIEEFPFTLECELKHTLEVGLHTLFVGEICDIKVDDSALDENENLDITRMKPFLYDHGSQGYYAIGEYLGKAFEVGKK